MAAAAFPRLAADEYGEGGGVGGGGGWWGVDAIQEERPLAASAGVAAAVEGDQGRREEASP